MQCVDAEQKLAARSHGRALQEDQPRRVDVGFAQLLFRAVDGVQRNLSGPLFQSENQNLNHE